MIGRRITPSLVVAALALFVALGGSAFAVRTKTAKLGCAAGAAKAYVTFDAEHFTGSFPQSFSGDPKLFARRYTCNGRTPQARGTSDGMEIRFPGLPAGAPIVAVIGSYGGFAVATIESDGVTYRIRTWDSTANGVGRGFTLVVL